jgi:N6-adenosine-specific RNA methylase IME4
MDIGAIKALEIPAAPDAALFLWATVPMLPQALDVMSAWGFGYKSHFVWVKDKIGTSYWNRTSTKFCWSEPGGNPSANAR